MKKKDEIIERLIRGIITLNELNSHFARILLLLNSKEDKEVDDEGENKRDS